MKKYIQDLVVNENIKIGENFLLLNLKMTTPYPEILPGQFVEIRVDNSPSTYLRRPISVHDVDYKNGILSLLIQKVGDGTNKLGELKTDDIVNLVYPLGKTFSIDSSNKKVLLVGGGVGVAPLYYLGKQLKSQGIDARFMFGARSKQHLICYEKYTNLLPTEVTTEDGSFGMQGLVTQHPLFNEKFDMIYVCGPTPMMKAVAKIAKERHINCEVSLENKMACGLGACLCCVTETKDGHKCVCSDGPVFNINDLNW